MLDKMNMGTIIASVWCHCVVSKFDDYCFVKNRLGEVSCVTEILKIWRSLSYMI